MPIWSKCFAAYASLTGAAPHPPPRLSPACLTGSYPDNLLCLSPLANSRGVFGARYDGRCSKLTPDNKRAVLQVYDAAGRLQAVGTNPQAAVCSVGVRRCRSAADIRSRWTLLCAEATENLRMVPQVITI